MAYSLEAVADWIAAWRAAQARRRTLVSLIEMSDARLLDLGIERQDIHLAMDSARREASTRAFVGASLIRPFAGVVAVLNGSRYPAVLKDWEREA